MWQRIEASFFYNHWERKIVLALIHEDAKITIPPPFAFRPRPFWGGAAQLEMPIPADPATTPDFPAETLHSFDRETAVWLYPLTIEDVGIVASNWVSILEGETWGSGPHLEHVGLEVADDPSAFRGFLEPEMALWRAFLHFRPSRATEYRLREVEEALEIGDLIASQSFGDRRRSHGIALQAMCDIAMRTMVFNKVNSMKSVSGERLHTPT